MPFVGTGGAGRPAVAGRGNAGGRARVVSGVSGIPVRRLAALHALWRSLARRRPGSPGLGDRLRALPRLAVAAIAGRYHFGGGRILLGLLAVAYLLSPIDFVPEALLGLFGLGDDAVVALWLGGAFLVETERFLGWERARGEIDQADLTPTGTGHSRR